MFGISIKDVATIALIVQVVIMLGFGVGVYLARTKNLQRHCGVMSVLVLVLIGVTALAMVAPLVTFIQTPPESGILFEAVVHHTLGTLVILIWIYVSLAFRGLIPVLGGRLLWPMRAAATFWAASFVLGVHMYFLQYV